MKKYFSFNQNAALEAILYVSEHVKHATIHRVSKILYFADKLHLQRYGRFICGDTYIAMEHGPVPSIVYDMMKDARRLNKFEFDFQVKGSEVIPLRVADKARLSQSDIECIDWAIERYDHMSFGQLSDESHDAAWQNTESNRPIDVLEIAAMVDGSGQLADFLQNQYFD